MINIVCITIFLSITLHAGFMDSVGDLVEATLSVDTLEVKPEITTVGTLSVANGKSDKKDDSMFSKLEGMVDDVHDSVDNVIGDKKQSSQETSILDDMLETAKETIGINEEVSTSSSLLDDTLSVMKEVTGIESKKKNNSYFDDGIMGDMAELISLEKGETLGLPSVFGINKKKQKKVFGSSILGDSILGDAKDAGTSFYRGFKNTGESTEFMSGVMYKSSKIYNEMFDIFDDSPLNIFDDKDEREPSIFNMVDKGNSILDIFD